MDEPMGGLAAELGIPPEVMREWTFVMERASLKLVPASRILELERDIEDLKRQLDFQAVTIEILEKEETLLRSKL